MEKTGVMFTEKAWKDFLDFLARPVVKEDQDVDTFVAAYYNQQKGAEEAKPVKPPVKQRSAEELDKLYNDIYEVMLHSDDAETLSIPEIIDRLKPYGYDNLNPKGFSNTMNTVMNKYPEIYRPGRGAYAFNELMEEEHPGEPEHVKYEETN